MSSEDSKRAEARNKLDTLIAQAASEGDVAFVRGESAIKILEAMGLHFHVAGEEPVAGKDREEWKPVDYCGTMTRPLAYFGNFEVKPETKELPWISDHTSGKVHDDMHAISMLLNESLTLPKGAENFIAQSEVLQEEAEWERIKATFYRRLSEDKKKKVFDVLNKVPPQKASWYIAKQAEDFVNDLIDIWNDSGRGPHTRPMEHCSFKPKSTANRMPRN